MMDRPYLSKLPDNWDRGCGIVLRGLQQLTSSLRPRLCLPHQVQCISEAYRRVQCQRSRNHGQLLAQVFRAHGCGGLRALLDTHGPLQNPLPTFPSCVIVPVSFSLSPLCSPSITVSAFVPLRPCPSLFSKVSQFTHLPFLDGARS